MNDKVVYVGPFQRRAERGTTETKSTTLCQKLGEEVTEEELRKFSKVMDRDFSDDFKG